MGWQENLCFNWRSCHSSTECQLSAQGQAGSHHAHSQRSRGRASATFPFLPGPPHPARTRKKGQQTFLLDHGMQLLPDALAPAGDVHVQRIVTAGLPICPLPPLLKCLHQTGLGVRHHVVHCRVTRSHQQRLLCQTS